MQHCKIFIILFILLFTNTAYSMESDETDNYERVNALKENAIKKYKEIKKNVTSILDGVTISNGHPRFVNEKDDTKNKEMLIVNVINRFSKPEEFLKKFIIQDNITKYIDMSYVLQLCEKDRFAFPFKQSLSGEAVKNEFRLAFSNGHIIKKGEQHQEYSLKEEGKFSFKTPSTEQTVLVLGCGHQSNICPNHMHQGNPTHYTVDIDPRIGPDAISNFYDKRLWESLERYPFEQVILEGINIINDSLLMKSIFNILTPGGIVKTLHNHSSLLERDGHYTPEAFLYRSTIPFIDEPLLTITYREYLEKIGFIEIEVYEPDSKEDSWPQPMQQLRASKPFKVDVQVSKNNNTGLADSSVDKPIKESKNSKRKRMRKESQNKAL
jgi:hypothetical protein